MDGKQVQALKEKGNTLFEKGDNAGASAAYTEALSRCPEDDKQTRRVLHSNRSAARLRAGDADGALKDADTCLLLGPGWSKGLFRKGSALLALGKFSDAVAALEGALLGEPQNQNYKEAMAKAQKAMSEPEYAETVLAEQKKLKLEAGSGTGIPDTANNDDPLAALFEEVAQIEKAATGKVLQVDHEAETNGWTSTNRIEHILQRHHKFLNLNPYHIFGLSHQANDEDIKKRYHKLSGLVHPDKNLQDERARDAFEIVKKAYDELMNQDRRGLLLSMFDVCHQTVKKNRDALLVSLGGREDLLIAQDGSFEEALDKEIKRVLALNERDRVRAEQIRTANEEVMAKSQMAKQPNWADVKRQVDERKEGVDSRAQSWNQFHQNKRHKG